MRTMTKLFGSMYKWVEDIGSNVSYWLSEGIKLIDSVEQRKHENYRPHITVVKNERQVD